MPDHKQEQPSLCLFMAAYTSQSCYTEDCIDMHENPDETQQPQARTCYAHQVLNKICAFSDTSIYIVYHVCFTASLYTLILYMSRSCLYLLVQSGTSSAKP